MTSSKGRSLTTSRGIPLLVIIKAREEVPLERSKDQEQLAPLLTTMLKALLSLIKVRRSVQEEAAHKLRTILRSREESSSIKNMLHIPKESSNIIRVSTKIKTTMVKALLRMQDPSKWPETLEIIRRQQRIPVQIYIRVSWDSASESNNDHMLFIWVLYDCILIH